MSENGGRGRGRAAIMARMLEETSESRGLPAVGRGSLLHAAESRVETSPSVKEESRPRGRGAFLAAMTASVASMSSQQESPTTPEPTIEPPKIGGRGRAAMMLEVLTEKPTNVTQDLSNLKIHERSPPKERLPPVKRLGTSGRKMEATANYIKLELTDPNKGIYEYEVIFNPGVDNVRERMFLVYDHFKKHGGGAVKVFDGGSLLFAPVKLEEEIVREKCQLRSGMETELIIKYKRKKSLNDCRQILNIIFKRIMSELRLVKFGRSDYNPQKVIKIQQHKLSIWPGCITAVDEYEGGVQLCLDASHRVLRDESCLEMLREVINLHNRASRGDGMDLKNAITTAFIGCSIITKYNNKVYKIDDVDFNVNPKSTFDKNGEPTSYISYYKSQYNIDIQDMSQPLFVHRLKRKPLGKENYDILLYLVPELCNPTGLTDEMRSNYKLMRDVADFTRCSPLQRQNALREFIRGIKENEKAAAHLTNWGLKLPDQTVDLIARVLDSETIHFGRNRTVQDANADWNRALSNNSVLSPVDLRCWAVIHTSKDARFVKGFLDTVVGCSGKIGMSINKPIIKAIPNDQAKTYCNEIRELTKQNIQIVVLVFPTNRDDRYSAVKKLCNADLGLASQVINSKTLSKPQALKSIVVKIVLQMNCKVGGTLWGVALPYNKEGIMFCGIDAYHEALKRTQSVVALVSSLNTTSTRWTSSSAFHNRGQEISDVITGLLKDNLQQWYKSNGGFPARIVVFRDGVGDGQLNTVKEFEVPQFKRMFPRISPDYQPKLTYVVVQKRINTRIYTSQNGKYENPPPGSIIDNSITRRDWYDFFLVSQNVRQGTVSPTHYVVVEDSSDMTPDQVQKLSYKMTHLYYNWSGTIRVPAPCQYAHKLAYLIGQHVHANPKENLKDLLYFL